MIAIHNHPCKRSSKLQLSIRFTPSRSLVVPQDWYPMYYPEGMEARVSPVQSIEPHRILAPTRNSNQEHPSPQSIVVTTTLPLHTLVFHVSVYIWAKRIKNFHGTAYRNARGQQFCGPGQFTETGPADRLYVHHLHHRHLPKIVLKRICKPLQRNSIVEFPPPYRTVPYCPYRVVGVFFGS